MQKILTTMFTILLSTAMLSAQENEHLKFVDGSFHEQTAAIGNMTFGREFVDNNENPAGLVRVVVEGIPKDEIKEIKMSVTGRNAIPKFEFSENRPNEIGMYIVAGYSGLTLTAKYQGQTANITLPKALEQKHIYEIRLRYDKTVSININTDPVTGAVIIFDDREVGKTGEASATIRNVTLGEHRLRLVKDGITRLDETITVTEASPSFKYDIQKKKVIHIKSNPKSATVLIDDETTSTMTTPCDIELPYGKHILNVRLNSRQYAEQTIQVGDGTPSEYTIELEKKKEIEVVAFYNGKQQNANLFVDNKNVGTAAVHRQTLHYGKHTLRASYSVYGDAKKTITVNDHSPSKYQLSLKPHNTITWPWEKDYSSDVFGITMAYVNKQWKTKGEGEQFKESAPYGKLNKFLHGGQIGFYAQPAYSWGGGIYTGFFMEVYFDSTDDWDYYDVFSEFAFYVPLHLYFRLPFSEYVALQLHGGLGMDLGIMASYSGNEEYGIEDLDYYGEQIWDDPITNPKRFNLSAEIAGTLRFKHIAITAQFSRGLTDHEMYKEIGDYKTRQNKRSIGISYVF